MKGISEMLTVVKTLTREQMVFVVVMLILGIVLNCTL